MASMNKALLLGNVGADPEIRSMENGRKVARFRLATSETYKDRNGEKKELTEWHTINAWDVRAELIERFVVKGTQILVEGRIKTRVYQDKNGTERYSTEIVADGIQLLGRTKESAPAAVRPAPGPMTKDDDGDGDLPF